MKSFIQFLNEASVYSKKTGYIADGQEFLNGAKKGAVQFSSQIDDYNIFGEYKVGYGPLIVVPDETSHDEEITLGDKKDKKLPSIKVKDIKNETVFMITGTKTSIEGLFSPFSGESNKEESGGDIDSRKFETDIVNEINKRNDRKATKGANDTPASRDLAKKVVSHFFSTYREAKSATQVSGSKSKSNLTPLYLNNGVSSGEPKTDILIDKNRCSVKKSEGAQFASAQGNEMHAVMTAALENKEFSKTKGDLVKNIKSVVKTALDKKNFYTLRANFGEGNAFDKVFGKVMGLNPDKPTDAEVEALNELFDKSGLGISVSRTIREFLTSQPVQFAMFTEFITGRGRFENENYSPSHIFAWSKDSGKSYYEEIDKYIKSIYPGGFKYRVSDRGDGRGGAFRLEPKHISEAIDLTPSEKLVAQQLTEEFDREIEMLDEGFLDKMKDLGSSALDIAKKGFRWLKSALKSVFGFFAMLLAKGVGSIAKVFGISADMKVDYTFPI